MHNVNLSQPHRTAASKLGHLMAWWRAWNERQLAAGASMFQREIDPLRGRCARRYY